MKQNKITTILASKGSGKTMLASALALANPKPTFFLSPIKSGIPLHKYDKLNESDLHNDFYDGVMYAYHIDNKPEFEETLQSILQLTNVCVVIDEIDFYYSASVQKETAIYQLCNYGRHKEIDLIVMSRRFQDIPKTLTAQTDEYFIGRIGRDYNSLEYIRKTLDKDIMEMCKFLDVGNFIRVRNAESNEVTLVKLPGDFINQLQKGLQ